jgi:hypothetical protein
VKFSLKKKKKQRSLTPKIGIFSVFFFFEKKKEDLHMRADHMHHFLFINLVA